MSDKDFILIPSPLVLPFSYHFLKPKLKRKYNLIIPTVPQIALTFSKKLWWNENDYAEWLLNYMNENQIERAFLLGHSNSGPVAIKFAELYPQRVHGVILADTIGVEQRSLTKTIWGRLVDAFIEWKLTLWGFWHLIWNFIFHAPNFIFQIRQAMKTDVLESAKNLKVPTLILWGRRDHTIPLFLGTKLNMNVSGSKMYISEKGSHDWIITHADEAVTAISDWTRSLVAAQDSGSAEDESYRVHLPPSQSHSQGPKPIADSGR